MKKIQDYFWIAVGIMIFGYALYLFGNRFIPNNMLEHNPAHTIAIIIKEKNYEPNQPVRAGFTYSYMFKANGKEYTGNSHDESLKIGDTVEIAYVKSWPQFNKPLHPKE